MKKNSFIGIVFLVAVLMLVPVSVFAQEANPPASQPPVSQPLIREGTFAVRLANALNLSTTTDEVEAESALGTVGISPRNGWIADYPVTPDVIGELETSISTAVDNGTLSIPKDQALNTLNKVEAEVNTPVAPYSGEAVSQAPPSYENYPNPTIINNYYNTYGPPVVTYYPPPPDYYYLYSWVPYPFFWDTFFCTGFFILVDFHRVSFVDRRVVLVTNHFVDIDRHRVFRIDPVQRFEGRTFAGIGAPRTFRPLSTGVRTAPRTIFNRNAIERARGEGRVFTPPSARSAPQGRFTRPPAGPIMRQTVPRSPGPTRQMAPPGRSQMAPPARQSAPPRAVPGGRGGAQIPGR